MQRAKVAAVLGLCVSFRTIAIAQTRGSEPLKLDATIPMADVQGRIDHLAIDVAGNRLFVAALGNDTIEVIDLKTNKRMHTIPGLAEPQGLAYVPSVNRLFAANAKDGSVRSFDATSWAHLKTIPYGDDADNLRIDSGTGHVWVGYGSGALAEFDVDGAKLGEIKLDAHPESFQFEKNGARAFVNLPKSHKIGVVDRKTRTVTGSWSTGGARSNYPMALDERNHRLFVVTRAPAKLIVLDTTKGAEIGSFDTIGDADDVFYDELRRRIYAIGGEGGISIFEQRDPDHYAELGRVKTFPGARTGFFSADLDRLYVAVRKHGSEPAAIRIYAPAP